MRYKVTLDVAADIHTDISVQRRIYSYCKAAIENNNISLVFLEGFLRSQVRLLPLEDVIEQGLASLDKHSGWPYWIAEEVTKDSLHGTHFQACELLAGEYRQSPPYFFGIENVSIKRTHKRHIRSRMALGKKTGAFLKLYQLFEEFQQFFNPVYLNALRPLAMALQEQHGLSNLSLESAFIGALNRLMVDFQSNLTKAPQKYKAMATHFTKRLQRVYDKFMQDKVSYGAIESDFKFVLDERKALDRELIPYMLPYLNYHGRGILIIGKKHCERLQEYARSYPQLKLNIVNFVS